MAKSSAHASVAARISVASRSRFCDQQRQRPCPEIFPSNVIIDLRDPVLDFVAQGFDPAFFGVQRIAGNQPLVRDCDADGRPDIAVRSGNADDANGL